MITMNRILVNCSLKYCKNLGQQQFLYYKNPRFFSRTFSASSIDCQKSFNKKTQKENFELEKNILNILEIYNKTQKQNIILDKNVSDIFEIHVMPQFSQMQECELEYKSTVEDLYMLFACKKILTLQNILWPDGIKIPSHTRKVWEKIISNKSKKFISHPMIKDFRHSVRTLKLDKEELINLIVSFIGKNPNISAFEMCELPIEDEYITHVLKELIGHTSFYVRLNDSDSSIKTKKCLKFLLTFTPQNCKIKK